MDYTITLTDTEKKSMEYIALDVEEWITNAATNRARKAKEEIIALNTKHCNDNSIAIAVGEDAQVTQAYTLGIIKTAKVRNEEESASIKAANEAAAKAKTE
tara:strand:- start:293 stop:595 length:303 start_codon:yes stop_codon:yes gene_type:complete